MPRHRPPPNLRERVSPGGWSVLQHRLQSSHLCLRRKLYRSTWNVLETIDYSEAHVVASVAKVLQTAPVRYSSPMRIYRTSLWSIWILKPVICLSFQTTIIWKRNWTLCVNSLWHCQTMLLRGVSGGPSKLWCLFCFCFCFFFCLFVLRKGQKPREKSPWSKGILHWIHTCM